MSTIVFWFRQDLRLHDQPALLSALAERPQHLLPVVCIPDFAEQSRWGFLRVGQIRQQWYFSAVTELSRELAALGCPLLILSQKAVDVFPDLLRLLGSSEQVHIVCEEIAAPEEQDEVRKLRNAGLIVRSVWQSSLLDPQTLPWSVQDLPAVFTQFRQGVEQHQVLPPLPLAAPSTFPPRPAVNIPAQMCLNIDAFPSAKSFCDPRSSFPFSAKNGASSLEFGENINGGERSGLRYLRAYLAARFPHTYKQTRNLLRNPLCSQPQGMQYSSKWSPWLASGALSARQIFFELRQFEEEHGANEGSYWLWFELLWRDYFRFLHLQYGAKLYHADGLQRELKKKTQQRLMPEMTHNAQAFERWCAAQTGEELIDAGMRELQTTGYVSNRMRQVLASYLIYQFHGDWRAGAAWFESQLIDYDVYSNQGNWLYIAGRGTDPRGGRIFNLRKQEEEYDKDREYRDLWKAT